MSTYANRNEAVITEIVKPIEAGGAVSNVYDEFDIDAIQDEVLGDFEEGYACKVTIEEFWTIVEKHAL